MSYLSIYFRILSELLGLFLVCSNSVAHLAVNYVNAGTKYVQHGQPAHEKT